MQYRFVLTECADSYRAKFTSEVGEPLEQVYRNKPIVIFTIKKTYCFITSHPPRPGASDDSEGFGKD